MNLFSKLVMSLLLLGFQASCKEQVLVSKQSKRQAKHKFTNRLINETSPYLLQHAHNPVNWYPWGQEAFDLAKKTNKPILVSIGYSACHWCHVMEHESFENEAIATILNEQFICIKVDREENPAVDEIYMDFLVASTGSGGWPLNVFLTPELQPFFGGTYFPPEDKWGREGFPTVLDKISKAWTTNEQDIRKSASQAVQFLENKRTTQMKPGEINAEQITALGEQIAGRLDAVHGGFSPKGPKFPAAQTLSFLLASSYRDKDAKRAQKIRHAADFTLLKMAEGGMYDQLGGGFARYSVDEKWLVPHFEKMLYDNALLVPTYLEAAQITGNDYYLQIVRETLDFTLRELTQSEGGFYSSLDADSEGVEGKFYVWTKDEIVEVLGEMEAEAFCEVFQVTEEGNFETEGGSSAWNVLSLNSKERKKYKESQLISWREKLMARRATRIRPSLDDKILVAWNGMMIKAMAKAAQQLGEPRYLKAAIDAAKFILNKMQDPQKGLMRAYREGRLNNRAYLDDYAHLIEGLLSLFEATADEDWLKEASRLADLMIKNFSSEKAFYFASEQHQDLILQSQDFTDNAVPSANAVAINSLLRLALISGEEKYRDKAEASFKSGAGLIQSYPSGMARMLLISDLLVHGSREIILVKSSKENTAGFHEMISKSYTPHQIVVEFEGKSAVSLLKNRSLVEDKSAVYICRDKVCDQPETDLSSLPKLLKKR